VRPLENYWVKTFSDNTQEVGIDSLVNSRNASWSSGRLDDLTEVELSLYPRVITVKIDETEYHQFDRYNANLGDGNKIVPTRIARILQVKITDNHLGKYLLYNIIRNNAYLITSSIQTKDSFLVTKDLIDKWATVILTKQGFFFQIGLKGKVAWAQVNI
jgi:hypothetical protein